MGGVGKSASDLPLNAGQRIQGRKRKGRASAFARPDAVGRRWTRPAPPSRACSPGRVAAAAVVHWSPHASHSILFPVPPSEQASEPSPYWSFATNLLCNQPSVARGWWATARGRALWQASNPRTGAATPAVKAATERPAAASQRIAGPGNGRNAAPTSPALQGAWQISGVPSSGRGGAGAAALSGQPIHVKSPGERWPPHSFLDGTRRAAPL